MQMSVYHQEARISRRDLQAPAHMLPLATLLKHTYPTSSTRLVVLDVSLQDSMRLPLLNDG